MDAADKAAMMVVIDELAELIQLDIRKGTDAEWLQRVGTVVQRRDGTFEDLVRLLSKWAAITTQGLAEATGTPVDQALTDTRLALVQYIEAS